ncbi:MAG: GNAT family N-acetyltransferase [Bacteroidota bacterium]|jgi:ribosomal protein S18 acetylase RimI-like enzyme
MQHIAKYLKQFTTKTMIVITEYSNAKREAFKLLNEEWLTKYFSLEPVDVALLSDPKKKILDAGGYIFYAEKNGEIVGTVALIKHGDCEFELGKMAVTEKAQGLGIGGALLEHCIAVAREKQAKKILLYSNTTLASAIHLYRKYGFVEVPLEPGPYKRSNIKMEKLLA